MYRGWFNGKREFGSATVPWEFCLAEWNAQFLGDRAFQLGEPEKANLRWEAQQFRAGNLWHRWDYPYDVGSNQLDQRYPIFAAYLTDNWRAFRTWGVSAISPWDYGHFWKLRDGVDQRRRELQVDWAHLQRPGYSPDYVDERPNRIDLAFERSDWLPTLAAEALTRNNQPVLACIAGKPDQFTSKDHIFRPGETVDKQIVLINNSRVTVTADCRWSFGLPTAVHDRAQVTLETGQQTRIPLRFDLPSGLAPGAYQLGMTVAFSTGQTQSDTFTISVPRTAEAAPVSSKIALFDPNGQTGSLLTNFGIRVQPVDAHADLAPYELLIVGKAALTVAGRAPDIRAVRKGLKVIIFEQSAAVLEKRFGFRVEEYGLRQVFARVPEHEVLRGISAEELRDWRGDATLLPPRLRYEMRPGYGPTIHWCEIPVTRVWRCGNRGNVASVLIEKPARGDFLPIVDGGYSLQYSPLLEYHEGQGLVVFCQLDVTSRTQPEPTAETIVRNLIQYVTAWTAPPARKAIYVGSDKGRDFLQSLGVPAEAYEGGNLRPDQVLVVGHGAARQIPNRSAGLVEALKAGGHLLGIGLDQDDANAWLPTPIGMRKGEHISAFFEAFGSNSPFRGISPADVHNRDPRELPLVSTGAQVVGDGVLANLDGMDVVFCQLEPWQFEQPSSQLNLRRTFRRTAFLVSRLLANMGVSGVTPLLDRFHKPVLADNPEHRWREGFYLDKPQEWDDPYRFFRW
jgi:hypothetical protein